MTSRSMVFDGVSPGFHGVGASAGSRRRTREEGSGARSMPATVSLFAAAFFASLPFDAFQAAGLTVSRLAALALLVCVLGWPRLMEGRRLCPAAWLPLAFGAILLTSSLWHPGGGAFLSWSGRWSLLQMIGIYWVLSCLLVDERVLARSLRWFFHASIVLAVLQISGIAADEFSFRAEQTGSWSAITRVSVFAQNPNELACGFALAIVVGAWRLSVSRGRKRPFVDRLVDVGGVAALAWGVILTGSRSGTITATLGVLVLVLSGRGARRFAPLVMIGALAVLVLPYLDLSEIPLLRRFDLRDESSQFGARDLVLEGALDLVRARPWLGVGWPRNLELLAHRVPWIHASSGGYLSAHSVYLNAVTAVGLIGTLPLVAAAVVLVRRLWRVRSNPLDQLVLSILATALFMGVAGDYTLRKVFWAMLAVAVARMSAYWQLRSPARPPRPAWSLVRTRPGAR